MNGADRRPPSAIIPPATDTDAGPRGTRLVNVLATNVYVKGSAGWQLLVHHAAPGAQAERPVHDTPPGKLH